jgi:predicted nucleotidyltransferase
VRLKDEEKQIILQAIHFVDPHAKVYLFGSRVDESGKGGDIDLLVFSRKMTYGDKLAVKKIFFRPLMNRKLILL